jgi:hypothetical protein
VSRAIFPYQRARFLSSGLMIRRFFFFFLAAILLIILRTQAASLTELRTISWSDSLAPPGLGGKPDRPLHAAQHRLEEGPVVLLRLRAIRNMRIAGRAHGGALVCCGPGRVHRARLGLAY